MAEPDWQYRQEENVFDVRRRVKKLLVRVARLPSKNLLLVSHGGFIKNLLIQIMIGNNWSVALSRSIFEAFYIDNSGVSLLALDDGSKYRILSINDKAHLAKGDTE